MALRIPNIARNAKSYIEDALLRCNSVVCKEKNIVPLQANRLHAHTYSSINKPNSELWRCNPLQNCGCLLSRCNIREVKVAQTRSISDSARGSGNEHRPISRVPKLIHIRNPLSWLLMKFDFNVLKHLWDPSFDERDFRSGTKQAISRVTNIISEQKFDDLCGLLTRSARTSLLKELNRTWTTKQIKLIDLSLDDIQIDVPRRIHFIKIADKRFCDIDVSFLALKWVSRNREDGLVFAEIFTRFHREYTPNSIPEWTIAYFKVTRFEILKR